jgi:DNA mismatch endonuclease (patch repair protein)
MADVHDKATRSHNMSKIRSKNTIPEIMIRKFLFSKGFRFRIYDIRLPGKPDVVLPKYKTVIFINGCFFHGHEGCKDFKIPKTNTEFWLKKFQINKHNDVENLKQLSEQGWKVITIFTCQLKPKRKANTLNELISQLY